ncbi:hypothetical protein TpMuguga_03g00776 [Theileria parva strain Muguga]|uniref:CBS domain-containing protein n=1 Tax=Theileria parva TaxID=5875 RepID=Q4MYR5_THEPA|nr:uncharacterized protein TpMuguga_03g00776 [Theileria parva strain Muguga]EAN30617.1 hypothetical protein TpMuguga_03g00776 [Theileria parva strain Muguga]|eukprot:XP_762900.1 hypothetical protein [Theileria parva strain Muguga]
MNIDSPLKNERKRTDNSDSSLSEYDPELCREFQLNFFSNLSDLLRSTSLCNILQSHSKILVINSKVPLLKCLKSMSNYHLDFALIYDSESMAISGYIDEFALIKIIINFDSYIGLNCAQFLKVESDSTVLHKLPVTSTSYEGFEYTLRNMANRVFVWSDDRKAPIGFVTPSCYLVYLVKNLRGKQRLLELPLKSIAVNHNFNKIFYQSTLKEALEFLNFEDNLGLVDLEGKLVGVLTRRKVTYYCLKQILKESQVILSTTLEQLNNHVDHIFNKKRRNLSVEGGISLYKAIACILVSNERILAYRDENGVDLLVTVWDIFRFFGFS